MERALRNRLTFGPIMLGVLFFLLWVDNAAESWTLDWNVRNHPNWNSKNAENRVNYGIGGTGLLVLLLLILPAATTELAVLFTAERVMPYRTITAAGSGALAVHAFCTQFPRFREVAASSMAFIIVFVMIAAALRRAWERQTHDAIVRMAGTVLATLYLGGLAWFLMAIRVKHSPRFTGSTMVVLMILLVVKSTDIGAYFGGRALGRRKLILWLSPGKTWEGLMCGVATAGLVGLALSPSLARALAPGLDPAMAYQSFPWWKGLIFGSVIGGIGQAGDLLESLMKRDAQVKDSGRLIPGFGGVLDVIDSPLFAAPFAYLLFSIFARIKP